MRTLGVVSAGLLFVFTATSAHAGGVDGTGAVGTCATVGQIKIKPALVNGGTSPGGLKVKTAGTTACSGGTGDGANVISSKGKGTATTTTNDCASLAGSQPSNLMLTVKWKTTKGTPKLNPSTISITGQTGSASSTPPNHGEFQVTGTVTAGSFSGDTVSGTIITDQDLNEILAACGAKGLKKITFGLAPSKDDMQMGSGSFTIN